MKTVASLSRGLDELNDAVCRHYQYLEKSGELVRRNRERVRIRIETDLKQKFVDRLIGGVVPREEFEALLDDVLEKRNNPHDAAEALLGRARIQ